MCACIFRREIENFQEEALIPPFAGKGKNGLGFTFAIYRRAQGREHLLYKRRTFRRHARVLTLFPLQRSSNRDITTHNSFVMHKGNFLAPRPKWSGEAGKGGRCVSDYDKSHGAEQVGEITMVEPTLG